MTFDPSKINLQQTCQVHGRTTVCVKTKVCFKYRIKSDKDTDTETGESLMLFPYILSIKSFIFSVFKCCFPLVIRYSLTLDSLRAIARGRFNETEDRRLQKNESIVDKLCREHIFYTSASKSVFSYASIDLSQVRRHIEFNADENEAVRDKLTTECTQ